ncbi:MAG TPA: DinB family protein [Gemmatimonadales bacterium]|nr:DinB family protein [Gemmatimonadales bacterium]
MIDIPRPAASEFNPYYAHYIGLVPEGNLIEILTRKGMEFGAQVKAIPEGRASFRYEPAKWSVAQVVSHVNDAERIFTCRALCFSRGEKAPLPSFDEKAYAAAAAADQRHIAEIGAEFETIRRATLALFSGMTESMFGMSGVASGHPITVRALAYIVAGHSIHHAAILKERYL